MKSYLIVISIISVISFSLIIFFKIRKMYADYCHIQDLKDAVDFNNLKIQGAIRYINSKYNDELNRAIIVNILPKIYFCQNLIKQRSLDDQVTLTRKLFDLIYETNQRLITTIDVTVILNPIKNFYMELARHKLKEVVETVDND